MNPFRYSILMLCHSLKRHLGSGSMVDECSLVAQRARWKWLGYGSVVASWETTIVAITVVCLFGGIMLDGAVWGDSVEVAVVWPEGVVGEDSGCKVSAVCWFGGWLRWWTLAHNRWRLAVVCLLGVTIIGCFLVCKGLINKHYKINLIITKSMNILDRKSQNQ